MQKKSRSQDLLEFEISFYEQLINDNPDFSDALMALGEAYTRRGLHEKGFSIDKRLCDLKPNDPIVWYNLACSLSLLKRLDESLDALRRSIELGYDDFGYIGKDPDLIELRRCEQFKQFLASRTQPSSS
jgi:tetratricopeptide (TPR) repeat protein